MNTKEKGGTPFGCRRFSIWQLPAWFAFATAAAATTPTVATAPTPTSTTPTTAASRGLRTSLVDREIAASEVGVVQLIDRLLGIIIGCHLDKGESSRTTRGHVAHHVDAFHRAGLGKQILQVLFGRRVRQVADVEFTAHCYSSLFRPACAEPLLSDPGWIELMESAVCKRGIGAGYSKAGYHLTQKCTTQNHQIKLGRR